MNKISLRNRQKLKRTILMFVFYHFCELTHNFRFKSDFCSFDSTCCLSESFQIETFRFEPGRKTIQQRVVIKYIA